MLDPRYKLAYVMWSFEEIYGEIMAQTMLKNVKEKLVKMYEWYIKEYEQPSESTNS